MRTKSTIAKCGVLLSAAALLAASPRVRERTPYAVEPFWPGEQMPLPLTVHGPEDEAFKQVAERHYLIFNLLASGKLAYDRGDMATAAAKWETLLGLPELSEDLQRVVRPLAIESRRRAGGPVPSDLLASSPGPSNAEPAASPPLAKLVSHPLSTVHGVVSGGGSLGAGGTVVWLKRRGEPTPRPRAAPPKTVLQQGKKFIPHVLAVPVGTTVHFLNEDEIFHNVFSLSKPNSFDLGLYRAGLSRDKTFNSPGPVDLLCNIHASMSAFIYVVDSPYYAQADRRGSFTIRGVPPGEYTLGAWHETSLAPIFLPLTVRDEVVNVGVTVNSDKSSPAFVPDKSGKPRQPNVGY